MSKGSEYILRDFYSDPIGPKLQRWLAERSALISRFFLDLKIKKIQLLANIYSAFGSEEESLPATADGFAPRLEDYARVLPGREVIAIAERP